MKCRCPACGRTTTVPPDMLHFLTRCDRCATLLKPFVKDSSDESAIGAKVMTPGRFREDPLRPRLPLAELLSRPKQTATPALPVAVVEVAAAPVPVTPRQVALRRAQLRGRHKVLGALSFMGGLTLVLTAVSVIGLRLVPSPRSAQAQMPHIHNAPIPVQPAR